MLSSVIPLKRSVFVGHGIHDFGCSLRRPIVKPGEENAVDIYMKTLSRVRIQLLGPSGSITKQDIDEPTAVIPLSIPGEKIGRHTYHVKAVGEVDEKNCSVTEEVRSLIENIEITVKEPFVGPPGKLLAAPRFVVHNMYTCM
ncbi:unnamed protein product [Dibothriocephalus latus]|uniref:Uncharacterized protein n=1 Tax=Dibothriocephalus latus TaxID=60516 RepID=A0A3P7LZH3_DIBLA|nr:unnamed protein product [Dibothriocephalus latus]